VLRSLCGAVRPARSHPGTFELASVRRAEMECVLSAALFGATGTHLALGKGSGPRRCEARTPSVLHEKPGRFRVRHESIKSRPVPGARGKDAPAVSSSSGNEAFARPRDTVIPAKAGTSGRPVVPFLDEIPASAGMTKTSREAAIRLPCTFAPSCLPSNRVTKPSTCGPNRPTGAMPRPAPTHPEPVEGRTHFRGRHEGTRQKGIGRFAARGGAAPWLTIF
jgi:hypothetical protein